MALRVLLADESNTIKRVIELSLQDYAVEVKPVHIGTDVVQIAKSYRPDVIFVDILLQKLSGYEVTKLLKADPGLQRIPVVIMWSGFMDFDEQKYKASQADAKLEKPFNSDTLRNLVQNLVAKTKTQSLSQFAKLPDFIEDKSTANVSPRTSPPPKPGQPKNVISIDNVEALEIDTGANAPEQSNWNMDSFEKIEDFAEKEEFAQVRLGKKPHLPQQTPGFSPNDFSSPDTWVQQDINKFRAPDPVDEEKTIMESLRNPDSASDSDTFEFTQPMNTNSKKLVLEDISPREPQVRNQPPPQFDEEALAAQTREVIEQVVWKVVPEIAERIIREELHRLIKEKDNELHVD